MKQDKKDKLDQALLKDKVKFYLIFIIPTIIFAALLITSYPVSTSNVIGTASKYSSSQDDDGIHPIIWVDIGNNNVRVSLPKNIKYIHGAEVELVENKTLIGIYNYSFLRYVE